MYNRWRTIVTAMTISIGREVSTWVNWGLHYGARVGIAMVMRRLGEPGGGIKPASLIISSAIHTCFEIADVKTSADAFSCIVSRSYMHVSLFLNAEAAAYSSSSPAYLQPSPQPCSGNSDYHFLNFCRKTPHFEPIKGRVRWLYFILHESCPNPGSKEPA